MRLNFTFEDMSLRVLMAIAVLLCCVGNGLAENINTQPSLTGEQESTISPEEKFQQSIFEQTQLRDELFTKKEAASNAFTICQQERSNDCSTQETVLKDGEKQYSEAEDKRKAVIKSYYKYLNNEKKLTGNEQLYTFSVNTNPMDARLKTVQVFKSVPPADASDPTCNLSPDSNNILVHVLGAASKQQKVCYNYKNAFLLSDDGNIKTDRAGHPKLIGQVFFSEILSSVEGISADKAIYDEIYLTELKDHLWLRMFWPFGMKRTFDLEDMEFQWGILGSNFVRSAKQSISVKPGAKFTVVVRSTNGSWALDKFASSVGPITTFVGAFAGSTVRK